MNNCSVIRDLLPVYVDRETSEETSAVIKDHLARCPECSEYYRHVCHITRSMKNPPRSNRYQYSKLLRQIRRRNALMLAAGSAVLLTIGCLAGKLTSSDMN